MDNPFVALGEAVHDGFDRLHKRADAIESGAEKKVEDTATEIRADLSRVEEAFDGRLAKLEAMFTPDAIAAVVEKLASAGKVTDPAPQPGAEPAPAPEAPAAPLEPEAPTAPAPTSVIAPSGATVTVDPAVGATTHEAEDGTVTVLPHDGSDARAHDAAMQPAEVKPEAVQEAAQATADAGVAVPEKAPAPEAANAEI